MTCIQLFTWVLKTGLRWPGLCGKRFSLWALSSATSFIFNMATHYSQGKNKDPWPYREWYNSSLSQRAQIWCLGNMGSDAQSSSSVPFHPPFHVSSQSQLPSKHTDGPHTHTATSFQLTPPTQVFIHSGILQLISWFFSSPSHLKRKWYQISLNALCKTPTSLGG